MIAKKFSKSFDDALTQAYLFHTNFVANQSAFSDFSSIFDDPFGDNFLALITTADDLPTFEDDQNDQAIYTIEVEETMVKARNHFKKLTFSIDASSPNSEKVQRAFRYNQFDSARNLPTKMINLLQNAYSKASSSIYHDDLIAAGFDDDDIDLIDSIENELTTKYNAQQDFIQQTYDRTELRTTTFNNVWDEMVKISNASKLIFKDSPAKIETFLLYPELSTGTGGGSGGGTNPNAPAAPSNFRYDYAEVTIRWDAVNGATSYKLESSTDNTNWTVLFDADGTEYNTGEILHEHTYLRIRSRNANGFSSYTNLNIVYNYILNGPANLTHVPALPGFTWNSVANATAYEVQLRDSNATDDDYINLYFGNSTQLYHADQVGTYYVRIRAWNNEGTSPWMLLAYVIAP